MVKFTQVAQDTDHLRIRRFSYHLGPVIHGNTHGTLHAFGELYPDI